MSIMKLLEQAQGGQGLSQLASQFGLDESKARADLGYKPHHDFDSGLAATLRWYIDNEAWWRNIQTIP